MWEWSVGNQEGKVDFVVDLALLTFQKSGPNLIRIKILKCINKDEKCLQSFHTQKPYQKDKAYLEQVTSAPNMIRKAKKML